MSSKYSKEIEERLSEKESGSFYLQILKRPADGDRALWEAPLYYWSPIYSSQELVLFKKEQVALFWKDLKNNLQVLWGSVTRWRRIICFGIHWDGWGTQCPLLETQISQSSVAHLTSKGVFLVCCPSQYLPRALHSGVTLRKIKRGGLEK